MLAQLGNLHYSVQQQSSAQQEAESACSGTGTDRHILWAGHALQANIAAKSRIPVPRHLELLNNLTPRQKTFDVPFRAAFQGEESWGTVCSLWQTICRKLQMCWISFRHRCPVISSSIVCQAGALISGRILFYRRMSLGSILDRQCKGSYGEAVRIEPGTNATSSSWSLWY